MTNAASSGREHKLRVLFLCVHNSGRSQMAEALLRAIAGDRFTVESAGFEPRPVLPQAVEAMRLAGFDISDAKSKSVFALFREGRIYEYVITVCDEGTAERCPIFPGICQRIHWTFPDPSAAPGSDAERLAFTIEVREQIRACIERWLSELDAREDASAHGGSTP
ncbi:MAG TPA: arsenate reductase ArsC [Polyangiaceae bacterium]